MLTDVPWVSALVGGGLIGLSATLLLGFNGRIAGISGMVNGVLTGAARERWRWLFLLGMVVGGALYEYGWAIEGTPRGEFAPWLMMVGGFLVGFGTRLGNGCTSGHGVCGLGRLSVRSLVAVLVFMATAIATVGIMRHGLGL
ncbi:YeeE/YedE family protein [Spirulina subsalsa]|uniref:YeeE/YedE family protein n=1 Tax=Spirulina subsalsa TaxID=54311 RepID=UPI00031A8A19|nr:YeeE/YedE thiosulfate transporter family protein [Spirulina subsalsa]